MEVPGVEELLSLYDKMTGWWAVNEWHRIINFEGLQWNVKEEKHIGDPGAEVIKEIMSIPRCWWKVAASSGVSQCALWLEQTQS